MSIEIDEEMQKEASTFIHPQFEVFQAQRDSERPHETIIYFREKGDIFLYMICFEDPMRFWGEGFLSPSHHITRKMLAYALDRKVQEIIRERGAQS